MTGGGTLAEGEKNFKGTERKEKEVLLGADPGEKIDKKGKTVMSGRKPYEG